MESVHLGFGRDIIPESFVWPQSSNGWGEGGCRNSVSSVFAMYVVASGWLLEEGIEGHLAGLSDTSFSYLSW